MYKQITIKTLHNQGTKNAQIARQLGCHRNTVSNIIAREDLIEKQTRVKESLYAAFDTQIKEYQEVMVNTEGRFCQEIDSDTTWRPDQTRHSHRLGLFA